MGEQDHARGEAIISPNLVSPIPTGDGMVYSPPQYPLCGDGGARDAYSGFHELALCTVQNKPATSSTSWSAPCSFLGSHRLGSHDSVFSGLVRRLALFNDIFGHCSSWIL